MASIFKNSKIKENLEKFEVPNLMGKIKIVKKWHYDYHWGSLKTDKETSREQAFNRDFFIKILGYTEKPANNYTLEPKATTETGQLPDLILGNLGVEAKSVAAVVELKGASIPLDRPQRREGNMSPIQQAFKYKTQYSSCPFVIASNFYEIRLFQDNQLDYEIWNLDDLVNPEDNYFQFRKFYYLLCADNFVAKGGKSKTEELLSDIRVEAETISKKFYKEYHELRKALLKNMWKNNKELKENVDFSIEKAQKIIDRVVFVCFCEDTGLLPEHTLKRVLDNAQNNFGSLWRSLQGFFEAIDEGDEKLEIPDGYNGGLFAPDPELMTLKIDDNVLSKLLDLGKYDFSEDLTVNILGHIFEQSISDLEEIKQKVQKDTTVKSKRKKDGIFYTPDYIVDYIVKNSLGKYLEEKEEQLKNEYKLKGDILDKTYEKRERQAYEKYQTFLQGVRVLDPACGSGAFLVKVFDYLLAEHKRVSLILSEDNRKLFDNETSYKLILKNNIYGVDLNQESVEITKLSLWLKTAQKNKKLTVLDDNIKCGNSLIDDPAVAGEKAFNWSKEFQSIMEKGGFDVIVGNPPYVQLQSMKEMSKELEKTNYKTFEKTGDLYCLFYEKGITLLKQGGLLGYITSNKWMRANYGQSLRKYFSEETKPELLIDLGPGIFDSATVDSNIIIIRKEKVQKHKLIALNLIKEKNVVNFDIYLKNKIILNNLSEEPWIILSSIKQQIKEKIDNIGIPLKNWGIDIYRGVLTGYNEAFIIDEKTKNELVAKDSKNLEIIKPVFRGRDMGRYTPVFAELWLINTHNGYVNSKGEKIFPIDVKNYPIIKEHLDEYFDKLKKRQDKGITPYNLRHCAYLENFEKEKIAWKAVGKNLKFSLLKPGEYVIAPAAILTSQNNKYLLAFLQSSFVLYFVLNNSDKTGAGDVMLNVQSLEKIPIPKVSQKEEDIFSNKVDIILNSNRELQNKLDKFSSRLKSSFNLAKISNKLEKFYELDFSDFIKELKKQKIEISLKDQDEWDDYFNQYKKGILDLKSQIDKTDKEIDQMVYALYGLTDKEIGVVEGGV